MSNPQGTQGMGLSQYNQLYNMNSQFQQMNLQNNQQKMSNKSPARTTLAPLQMQQKFSNQNMISSLNGGGGSGGENYNYSIPVDTFYTGNQYSHFSTQNHH